MRLGQLTTGKRRLPAELISGRADQHDLPVELAYSDQHAGNETFAETDLHHHEQHRKRNSSNGSEEALLVGKNIAPRKGNASQACSPCQ